MFSTLVSLATVALLALAAPTTDLEQRQSCADVIVRRSFLITFSLIHVSFQVVFARGTTETPTIGSIVGPQFQSAIQSAIGSRSLSFRGVDYPATVAGFLAGGDPAGSRTMASDVRPFTSSCAVELVCLRFSS
jgi:cutinase